jgi:hypothetical protein
MGHQINEQVCVTVRSRPEQSPDSRDIGFLCVRSSYGTSTQSRHSVGIQVLSVELRRRYRFHLKQWSTTVLQNKVLCSHSIRRIIQLPLRFKASKYRSPSNKFSGLTGRFELCLSFATVRVLALSFATVEGKIGVLKQ